MCILCLRLSAGRFMRKLCKHLSLLFSPTGNMSVTAFFASKVEFSLFVNDFRLG